eukprot:8637371-Alexandrium_andersonii.AAC.1
MSASLVGSEMCIRDREHPARREGPEAMRGGGETPRGGGCRRRTGKATPVSYTHLTLPTICSV